jgi:hypothetical protein
MASFPSSYIPTTTTSVLRAADVLTYTAGLTYPLGLWAEFERAVDTGGAERIIQVDDGGSNNRVICDVSGGDVWNPSVISAGSTVANLTVGSALPVSAVHKGVARFELNDVNAAINGTLGTADTSAALPATPTRINIGGVGGTVAMPFGYIRKVAATNFAPTDAQLQLMAPA